MKIFFILFALILSACGGGGGDSSSTSTAPSSSTSAFALNTAASNIFSSQQTFNMSTRTPNGQNLSANISFTPQPDAVFEGQISKVSQVTSTLSQNNVVIGSSTSNRFFSLNPFLFRGGLAITDPEDQGYIVYEATSPFPASANVGSTGPVATARHFTNSSKTTQIATEVLTYSLEADTTDTAFLCINSTLRDTFNMIVLTASECLKIDTNGTLLGLKLSIGNHENGELVETVQFQ